MEEKQMELEIMRAYQKITTILQPRVKDTIPKLAITRGNSFWGRIRCTREFGKRNFIDIRINVRVFTYLANNPGYHEKTWEDKLIETICHEIAHMEYWDHSYNHQLLTQNLMGHVSSAAPVIEVAAEEVTTEGTITKLQDITTDTKKARAALRKAGIAKPGNSWEWTKVPSEVQVILKGKGLLK